MVIPFFKFNAEAGTEIFQVRQGVHQVEQLRLDRGVSSFFVAAAEGQPVQDIVFQAHAPVPGIFESSVVKTMRVVAAGVAQQLDQL